MGREKWDRTDSAVTISGSLGEQLEAHARERVIHFFMYLFYVKALTDYANAQTGGGLGYTGAVSAKATYQIDEGHKSGDPTYLDFNNVDPKVVDESCTHFSKIDAAHFCNLGLKEGYIRGLPLTDATANELYNRLKTICGNTRWLPKRVNIGPDRIIDKLHGELAVRMLGKAAGLGRALISLSHLQEYRDEATEKLGEYRTVHKFRGNLGVAACTQSYIDAYPKHAESIWTVLTGYVWGECEGFGLDSKDFLAFS